MNTRHTRGEIGEMAQCANIRPPWRSTPDIPFTPAGIMAIVQANGWRTVYFDRFGRLLTDDELDTYARERFEATRKALDDC